MPRRDWHDSTECNDARCYWCAPNVRRITAVREAACDAGTCTHTHPRLTLGMAMRAAGAAL